MARRTRSSSLETRTSRLKLAVRRKPYSAQIAPRIALCNPFKAVVERLGLDNKVTPYALRHSSIVRQLLNGVPVRVVAAHHDTSVEMLERHYSRFIIGDPSEALTRATLLDFGVVPSSSNVVPLERLAS
jgi:integrase